MTHKSQLRRVLEAWRPATQREGQAMLAECVGRAGELTGVLSSYGGETGTCLDLIDDLLFVAYVCLPYVDEKEPPTQEGSHGNGH